MLDYTETLIMFQIFGDPVSLALERHAEYALALSQISRIGCPEIPEERMDGRQTRIPGAYRVLPNSFNVVREIRNQLWGSIFYHKIST